MGFSLAAIRRWCRSAALMAMLPMAVQAQTVPDWTVGDAAATGVALAVDVANNTLALGTAAGPSMQLTKVGPAGAVLWQRNAGPAGALARGTSVSVDAGGHTLVTGYRVDATGFTPAGAVVSKFDAAGNLLWQDALPAASVTAVKGLQDAAGNAYVLLHQPAASATGGSASEVLLTLYNAAGVRQWTRNWGASFAVAADSMVLTPAGQVVVAGLSAGPATVPATVVVAAFDVAGNALWSTLVASDADPALAVSTTGEIAVVGARGPDFMVAKFNATFGPLWVRTYPARGQAMRAAFDTAGNLVVNGVTDLNTGNLAVVLYGWMTIKVDAAGNLLWTHIVGTSPTLSGEVPAGLALGSDGAIYLTGQTRLQQATGSSAPAATTLKLSAAGTQVWRADTTATAAGVGLKLGSDGGVRVLGSVPQLLMRYPQSGQPNVAPVAWATANPSAGPAPLTVQFSSAGSNDPDGVIASYAWDFGDGQSSAAASPSHVYAAGQYTARLTVTDVLGASSAAAPLLISANAVVATAKPTSLRLSTNSVTGGRSVLAKVSLSNSSGATLSLSSSNPAAASVPAVLVVPAGATSASFTITTSPVRRDTKVTIGASANGAQVSAQLKVERR